MRELIEKIVEARLTLVLDVAVVDKISDDNCQVTSLTTKKKHFKCSLNAVYDDLENKLVVYPKVGSTVVIGIVDDAAFVLSASDVSKVLYKQGQTEMIIDASGYKIERAGENLGRALTDFMNEVNKIIVVNGTSINVPAVNAIKDRLNKILV